jgi:NAD(P)-dependent dehydrogenase (short-subunit alcohol dehydrogenase family)
MGDSLGRNGDIRLYLLYHLFDVGDGLSAAGTTPYAASKHGVVGLTRVAAAEYAGEDIRVNAVCPGIVETPLVTDQTMDATPEMLDRLVGDQLIERMAAPAEVANAVAWLSSTESSYVTGHPLVVDGGQMVQ